MKYQPVIGLEVHVELKTKSKMFCRCTARYFGEEPNTHTCPVCLGLPGALPVPNRQAIEWCVMIGMALNCHIPLFSKFDRKNYFYPDLAKGYQISQYDHPFCINGKIVIARNETMKQSHKQKIATLSSITRDDEKIIRIRRVHMEEDTGKLIHETINGEKVSLIDFNRSGVPLVEIVTEPEFTDAKQVKEYLQKLQQIVRYLGVSDADMEKGNMRLEPNISLRLSSRRTRPTDSVPKYKVEVKNINSFRFVEKAIEYEITRQQALLEIGEMPAQETRGWDEKKQKTVSQRLKEEANDYRYFPEPDIPPIRFEKSYLSKLQSQMPELPDEKRKRFQKDYSLSPYDCELLTREKHIAEYFEEMVRVNTALKAKKEAFTSEKTMANWIINKKIDTTQTLPAQLIQTILVSSQTIVLPVDELEKIIEKVLSKNLKPIEDYKKGETKVIGFFIGEVKKTLGKPSDTAQIKSALEKKLSTL